MRVVSEKLEAENGWVSEKQQVQYSSYMSIHYQPEYLPNRPIHAQFDNYPVGENPSMIDDLQSVPEIELTKAWR